MVAAVSLSASLVVAVATCIESVRGNLEVRLLQLLGAADARIVHLFEGRFDAGLLDDVRRWPEVENAVARYTSSITLIRLDRRPDPETGQPQRMTPFAYGIDPAAEFDVRPVNLERGRSPGAADEILLDSIIAEEMGVGVGEQLELQRFGEPMLFNVVGIAAKPVLGMLQRPRVYLLRETLEEATGRRGQISDIAITLHSGVDIDAFCAKYIGALPEHLSLEPAELARTGFDRRLEAASTLFILLSVFAFFACSYLILIGMTTGISERQRELAIMRCIGAPRTQLFASQLWVGTIIGAIGAVIGVPLGVGFASALILWFREYLPEGVFLNATGLFFGVIGSLGAGLLGAVLPAALATRVSPLIAMAVRARPVRARSFLALAALGILLILVQVALLLPESEQTRFWLYVTCGMLLMQVAYFMLAIPVFVLIARAAGGLLSRALALPADLLPQSAMSVPYRLGLTAGALTIGLALLVATWTSTSSLLSDWLGQMQFADGFAYSRNGIQRDVRERIRNLPFVTDTLPIGYLPLQVLNRHVFGVEGFAPPNVVCIGFEPHEFFEVNHVKWVAGTPEGAIPRIASGEGILVAEEFLTARGISVGDTLELGAGRVSHEFQIVGVVSAAGLDVATQMFGIRDAYAEHALSCVFADFSVLAEMFDNPDVYLLQVNLSDDVTDDDAREGIARAAPGVLFVSGRSIKDSLDQLGAIMLSVNSTIAFAALILACLAVGNVLIANVRSRQFEYAVLRSVGAGTGHLARLVVGEAVLLAMTAIVVGTVYGFHGALIDMKMQRDLLGMNPSLRISWEAIAIGWAVLLLMTILAAAPAARGLITKSPRELLSAGRGGA